jgi:hypothetical protein
MTPLAIPFKLRAKIEKVRDIYWRTGWHWIITLSERGSGLPPHAYNAIELPCNKFTRAQAIEQACEYYARYDIEAVFRKAPVRKPTLKQRKLAIYNKLTQEVNNDTQTI